MARETVAALLKRSRPYALEGKYEFFKIGATFDGTAKNATSVSDEVDSMAALARVME